MFGCAEVADWVFVSPHLDDVVLSCGGAVAKSARSGSPRIVTVFAGSPDNNLSDFAQFQHERWQLDNAGAVEVRRNEDKAASREIGDSVQTTWLEYLDAIYRDPGYSSDEALFGLPLKCDLTLAQDIHEDLRRIETSRYVIPMGVGNHVDHQIVREAGLMLLRQGAEVWMYAEVPYALDNASVAVAISQIAVHEPVIVRLDEDALQRKLAAVRSYESQLPVLFRDRGDPLKEIEAFARQQGGGEPVELLWKLRPERDPLLSRRPFVA
jgi:LmbE family N-acetylglucosaminyl deacetylase